MSRRRQRDKEARRIKRGEVINRVVSDDLRGRAPFIDEIVADNCTVHVEVMCDQSVSLMIYTPRETVSYEIGTKRAHVTIFESWRGRTQQSKSAAPKRRGATCRKR